MSFIYLVSDDREGLNTILATYDNEPAAYAHSQHLAANDDEYGDYFTVTLHQVKSAFTPDSE